MIYLVDINPDNWRLDLKVSESQKDFVASSSNMLARAFAYRKQRSRVFGGAEIDHDADEIIMELML